MKKTTTCLLSAFGSRALCLYSALFTAICALWLAIPSMVYGQNLDDFKTAAGNTGVQSIPFSSLRVEAVSISDEVERRKKELKDLNLEYDLAESQKNKLLKGIAQKKDLIEMIKKDIKDYSSRFEEFDPSSLQDDINKLAQDIEEIYKGKIKSMNESMKKAVEVNDRLSQARGGLREHFDQALSQLSDAKSNPEKYLGSNPSDDDKAKLRDYIGTIEDHIKSEAGEHRVQEDAAKQTSQKFDALMKKDSI